MWLLLSLLVVVFWSGSDFFSKSGTDDRDNLSHLKITAAVGIVMGLHATFDVVVRGVEFKPMDMITYLPVSFFYIVSMVIGYIGLRYIVLTISTPICNASGAVAAIICFIFLNIEVTGIQFFGILLATAGIIMLSFLERDDDGDFTAEELSGKEKRLSRGVIGIILSVVYCVLDALGTALDTIVLSDPADRTLVFNEGIFANWVMDEGTANVAYEYTFLICAILCAIYVYVIKKEKFSKKYDTQKIIGAVCETAGQFAYIFVVADTEHAVMAEPVMSAYCVLSCVWARIFLKEKLTWKHYAAIGLIFLSIIVLSIWGEV